MCIYTRIYVCIYTCIYMYTCILTHAYMHISCSTGGAGQARLFSAVESPPVRGLGARSQNGAKPARTCAHSRRTIAFKVPTRIIILILLLLLRLRFL